MRLPRSVLEITTTCRMKCIQRADVSFSRLGSINRTNGLFDKAPARRFLGDFINFSDPFFFPALFSLFFRYKLNSFLVVMALHCLIMTALEETECIALRDFAKSVQPKNLIFDQIETKLTSEMEEEKPFIFAGFSPPTRSCLFCFHMMTFS